MMKNENPPNLVVESFQLDGARQMLLRLLDVYKITNKERTNKNDAIYTKADLDLILSSKENTRHFLCGDMRIHYRGNERDKNGKLVRVEAYFAP